MTFKRFCFRFLLPLLITPLIWCLWVFVLELLWYPGFIDIFLLPLAPCGFYRWPGEPAVENELLVWLSFIPPLLVPVIIWNIALRFKRWRVLKGFAIYLALCAVVFGGLNVQNRLYWHRVTTHNSRAEDNPLGEWFQKTTDEMLGLLEGFPWPEDSVVEAKARGEAFDVQSYFTVLTNISMQAGYVLDYVYYDFGIGSEPVLLARRTDQTAEEVMASEEDESPLDYVEHVQINGTKEGFLEYAALHVLGEQFYLRWHACYNDTQIVSSKERAEKIFMPIAWRVPEEERELFPEIDLVPSIQIGDSVVTVSFLTFSKWGGFEQMTLDIKKDFPHQILREDTETIISYRCSIIF